MSWICSLLGLLSLFAFIYCAIAGMAGLGVLFFVFCLCCEIGCRVT